MTTATATDDELLIITDDVEESDTPLVIGEETEKDENIITFDEDPKEEKLVTEDIKVESEIKDSQKEDELNLDFDLGGEQADMTVEDMFGDNKDEVGEEEKNGNKGIQEADESDLNEMLDLNLDMQEASAESDIKEEKQETDKKAESDLVDFDLSAEDTIASEVVSLSGDGDDSTTGDDDDDSDDQDVNTILEATIAKLITRRKKIEEVKSQTMGKISELQAEIKSLEADVRSHKKDVKDLDNETKKIEENVEGLKKMKMKK